MRRKSAAAELIQKKESRRKQAITGATGCGRTCRSCAFGMEACRHDITTKYMLNSRVSNRVPFQYPLLSSSPIV
ncbi:ATP-binding protein [Enterocloster clostridioformis]|uniref:ATP-binding protein n=1 Tax=Enterocloster clostridioformis TaxID=1531 RepID=A0AAP9M4L6_9FIRM|nr:ATP-binding protein [Enterocloster clostridioformis]MCF2703849.1 ATP-binding protein [Enterocloster clostridioformis]NSD54517.1 ATP-binding protein [Enterocloster clostridioformis]NSJ08544.1 ATP-binding protein [Enterocloster clostridioformis]NSJ17365.1 ATP-binding protein [Enterocloster clostridioformis]